MTTRRLRRNEIEYFDVPESGVTEIEQKDTPSVVDGAPDVRRPIVVAVGIGGGGEPGPEGPEGPAGPQGIQGIQGLAGPQGETGPQGSQGIPGSDGADGSDGAPGAPGAPGADGDQGIQGIQGVPGNDGAAGAQGPQGDDGPIGPEGPPGTPGEAWPVGGIFIAAVSTNPATLLGYGTWAAFGAGKVLVSRDSGDADFDTAEETGGGKTKSISAHSGAAVGNHAFTQPSGHSAHVFTQPGAHAAHTDHSGVPSHVHRQQYNPTTTGAGSGPTTAPDTSSSGTTAWGTVDTQAPAGAANQTHTAHDAHSGGAVDAHSAHAGGAVDAHVVTQAAAHTDINVMPPYIVVYMWKRTA
jgi:hypothetical protein